MAAFLVHFKSRDLARLHKQGQFWHIFFSNGSAIISQDEVDTWTTHLFVPLDTDIKSLDPKETVYQVLGGSAGPYPIEIDKVLVTSSWRPNICISDRYRSDKGRVFLSGDAAHQNVPTGGYGMNSAVGDSFDIGWKVSAVLSGWGGEHLLRSYEIERRPVAVRNIDRSGVHMSVHGAWWEWCREAGSVTTAQTEEGKKLRARIADLAHERDGENKEIGIEMGYRYNGSPIVVPDTETEEPMWEERRYIPSTWPGARPPHVFLKDGETSIFDLFGTYFTFIDFSSEGKLAQQFGVVAKDMGIPLKRVHLPHEHHARKVWERDGVLIRPDDFVAWRTPLISTTPVDAEDVLLVAVGRKSAPNTENTEGVHPAASAEDKAFTATIGNVDQENVAMMAEFQK